MNSDNEIKEYLLRQKTSNNTWQEVGARFGITGALAWKVAHGKCNSRKLRAYFGIRKESVDRMAARLTTEEGEQAREIISRMGFDSITDYWRSLLTTQP